LKLDRTFERAKIFMENVSKRKPGLSNIYVFTLVDKLGNIVDEKYGMNLMTNQGFQEIYAAGIPFNARDTQNNTVRLYVGTGVGETPYTTSDTDLEIPAFGGLAATNSNTTKAFNYPMYYSKGAVDGEGFITLISRFVEAYYDYNITNYPGDYDLTEYGIKHNNVLWTHSRIYSIQGSPASIRKTSNERLFITVYMCMSFYESIIMNGWANNRFAMITRNDIMYDRMAWSSRVNIYKRNNRVIDITNGGVTRTQDTTQNNEYTNSTIAPQIVLTNNNSDTYDTSAKTFSGGYFDGFVLKEDGLIIVEPQFLTTPENVSFTNLKSNNPTEYHGFADKFGMNPDSGYSTDQYPQMTHFFDADASLFDYKSGTWSCKLDVFNPDNKWYDETSMETNCGLPIYYSNNGQIMEGFVYQNLRVDDKIVKIISGGVTIYATNKYWAVSDDPNNQDPDKGWVWIRDYNNIPLACQTARYWITNTNTDSLSFVRESESFQLLEKGTNVNGYVDYLEYAPKTYIKPICDNYDYGWYKRGDTVYVPGLTGRQTFTVGSDDDENMTYGKWLITFPSVNNVIISTDMSNATTGVVSPQNVTLPFTGNVNSLTQTHRTESGTGIICIESTNTEETVIIDMRQNPYSVSVHSWKHACCIWGTDKVAYINAGTSDPNVYIYDYSTSQQEGVPIPFPSGISDIPHLFGHTNYLWMTDGSTFGYVCDLRTPTIRNLDTFTYNGLYGTNLNEVKYTCVDDVFIVYKFTECGSDSIKLAHYIKLSDPTNPHNMNDFSIRTSTSSIGGLIIFDIRYVNKYTNTLGTKMGALALTIMRGNNYSRKGCECMVFDFGQYLNTGEVIRQEIVYEDSFGNFCLYGENIIYRYTKKIPMSNFMPIKLTGKTDTINAMNRIKNITGKSWLIGYTNTPSWGDGSGNPSGKPPGVPLARTDSSGTITGWG